MILEATWISMKVVISGVIITLIIALLLVFLLGLKRRRYSRWIETLIILPMFVPPSALGYMILLIFGRRGLIGGLLYESFGITIIFTLSAGIIASIIVTIPIMYQSIKSAILSVDKEIINSARIMGASEFTIFTRIVIPLSRKGIINGVILSFGRAFGEFGATILVAGNIPGKTQTIPMAMYYAIETNKDREAFKILIIVLIVAVFLMSIHSYISKERVIRRED